MRFRLIHAASLALAILLILASLVPALAQTPGAPATSGARQFGMTLSKPDPARAASPRYGASGVPLASAVDMGLKPSLTACS